MEKESKTHKTLWHRLLGTLLEELLVPVGISVFIDFPVMSKPPESDILLLRKEGHTWTEQQKARLPDGIRDSSASHILIEFKYSESVSEYAFRQIVGYDHFFRTTQRLKNEDVESFLVDAKTPKKSTLEEFGYAETEQPGVFRSTDKLLKTIALLALNELPDTEHNVWFKCFASRLERKESAFDLIIRNRLFLLTTKLRWILDSLYGLWFEEGENIMKDEITPERIMELGKRWRNSMLSHLEPEEIDKILSTLNPDKRLAGLRPEDRLAGLRLEDRLAGLRPEDRLAGLKPEEIKAYLKKIETQKKKQKRSRKSG